MNCQIYQKLFIANIENVTQTIAQSFIMCGTENWDFYFGKRPRNCESEILTNVSIIEFDSFDEFKTYKKHNTFLDFSLEHEKPMVLVHG